MSGLSFLVEVISLTLSLWNQQTFWYYSNDSVQSRKINVTGVISVVYVWVVHNLWSDCKLIQGLIYHRANIDIFVNSALEKKNDSVPLNHVTADPAQLMDCKGASWKRVSAYDCVCACIEGEWAVVDLWQEWPCKWLHSSSACQSETVYVGGISTVDLVSCKG